jgi:hypothetical protein
MSKPFGDLVAYGGNCAHEFVKVCIFCVLRIGPWLIVLLFSVICTDPTWYQGWHSPYYNASHVALRAFVRQWVDQHIMPNCDEWDEKKSLPKDLFTSFAKV